MEEITDRNTKQHHQSYNSTFQKKPENEKTNNYYQRAESRNPTGI